MEENMQSIKTTFTAAATGKTASPGFSFFWMMVWGITILDDSDRREKDRRRNGDRAAKAAIPKPPTPR